MIIIKIGFIIEPQKNHIIDGNITEACLVRLTREITIKYRLQRHGISKGSKPFKVGWTIVQKLSKFGGLS